MVELPEAKCPIGYPKLQVAEIFGMEYAGAFFEWMRHSRLKTGLCRGEVYAAIFERRHATVCRREPHGEIFMTIDLTRFIKANIPLRLQLEASPPKKGRNNRVFSWEYPEVGTPR